MKRTLFFIIAICLLAISCTSEPYITISESNSNNSFGALGGNFTLTFSTNYAWTAESSASWISLSPDNGDAGENINVRVSVSPNPDYDKRSATINIKAGEVNQLVTIDQARKEGFILSETSFNIGISGGTIKIPVKSNIDYKINVANECKNWISVTQTKGLSDYEIIIIVSNNDTYDKRTGSIEISYNPEFNLTVQQHHQV